LLLASLLSLLLELSTLLESSWMVSVETGWRVLLC